MKHVLFYRCKFLTILFRRETRETNNSCGPKQQTKITTRRQNAAQHPCSEKKATAYAAAAAAAAAAAVKLHHTAQNLRAIQNLELIEVRLAMMTIITAIKKKKIPAWLIVPAIFGTVRWARTAPVDYVVDVVSRSTKREPVIDRKERQTRPGTQRRGGLIVPFSVEYVLIVPKRRRSLRLCRRASALQ